MSNTRYLHTSENDRVKETAKIDGVNVPVHELLDDNMLIEKVSCLGESWKSPLFIFKPVRSEKYYPLSKFVGLFDILGFFHDVVREISVYFIEDGEEESARSYIAERLEKDASLYIAYDQTGTFDDIAEYPSGIFRFGNETPFSYTGGVELIRKERLEYIAQKAIASEMETYANVFGFKEHAFENGGYENVRSAIDAYGLGHVKFGMDEAQFDTVTRTSTLRFDPFAENIMEALGEDMSRYEEWLSWKTLIDDTLKIMRVWSYALRISGAPFNVLGYRLNESEIYDRRVDAELTAQIAELIGVDSMLESVFVHEVPIEDVLA